MIEEDLGYLPDEKWTAKAIYFMREELDTRVSLIVFPLLFVPSIFNTLLYIIPDSGHFEDGDHLASADG